jgi:hypothetical protein
MEKAGIELYRQECLRIVGQECPTYLFSSSGSVEDGRLIGAPASRLFVLGEALCDLHYDVKIPGGLWQGRAGMFCFHRLVSAHDT